MELMWKGLSYLSRLSSGEWAALAFVLYGTAGIGRLWNAAKNSKDGEFRQNLWVAGATFLVFGWLEGILTGIKVVAKTPALAIGIWRAAG